jgi:membrane-bound ClpP family serine protease
MPRLSPLAFLCAALFTTSAHALEVNGRRLEVSGGVDTKVGMKLVTDLMKLDEVSNSPIYLIVSGSGGSAQGVMMVSDAIRSIEAPVVAVVMSPVHGATATLALFADRLVMLPSAQLVFTEVDYEGVARPPEAKDTKAEAKGDAKPDDKEPKKEVSKADAFMQSVRKDYLDRFWAAVGKRLNEKGPALQATLESQGGRVLTAQEALSKKVAYEVVTALTTTRSANEKTELKVTTTQNKTRTSPAPKPLVN